MATVYCGDGSGKEMLDKVPPDGENGRWTKGRVGRGDCDVWYHHDSEFLPPCEGSRGKPMHSRYTLEGSDPCRSMVNGGGV